MPKNVRALWPLLLALLVALPISGQNRPELAPDAIRAVVREVIPRMNRMLNIHVFEPIPVQIVNRDQFKTALTRDYTNALLRIQQIEIDPEPMARPIFVPDRARRIADQVADRLTSRFLIRFVFDGESKLLVVPENLTAFLDPDELPSRQIGPLVRFALVRELTRLSDDERWRLAEKEPPLDNELSHLTARLALREGHAQWAASQLARASIARSLPCPTPARANTPADTDVEQILYATVGKGCERARLHVSQTAKVGKSPALHGLLANPPRSFADFPELPSASPPEKRPPDPLARSLQAITELYTGEGWSTTIRTPDRKSLAASLGQELPTPQVKRLLAGLDRIQESTATNTDRGQINLTVAGFTNPSAAYAWCRAEEQRLANRTRTMVAAGDTIQNEKRETHDWPGFPVLFTVQFTVETDDETFQVYQTLAVCHNYCLSVRSIHYPVPWSRMETYLKVVLPILSTTARDPG